MSVAGLEERLSSSTKRVWLRETSRWRTLDIKIVMMRVTWLLNSASATRWYPWGGALLKRFADLREPFRPLSAARHIVRTFDRRTAYRVNGASQKTS